MLRPHAGMLALASGLALAATAAAPSADACGGCFHGAGETITAVTAHRMVVAIHATDSILWDQIRYSGSPSDFSWVLPVWGDVQIELASADFFDTLDAATSVRVSAPFVNNGCSGGGGIGFGCGASAGPTRGAFSADASSAADSGVTILHESVVGPYQTVTLRGTDAMSLTDWLGANNYVIPASTRPVIQYYVDHGMDFVALRLRPDRGVQAMQPIRVRYHTANMVLPLRMISAGVNDKVGITLWVFGSGRYEPANFGSGEVHASDVVWDWTSNRSNYNDAFDQAITRLGGRAWITEYAQTAQQVRSPTSLLGRADFDLAVGTGTGVSGLWITRLRTNLAANFLDADLQLQASPTANAAVSNTIQATRTTGTQPGPVCATMVLLPNSETMLRRPGRTLVGALASVLALLVTRRRKREGTDRR